MWNIHKTTPIITNTTLSTTTINSSSNSSSNTISSNSFESFGYFSSNKTGSSITNVFAPPPPPLPPTTKLSSCTIVVGDATYYHYPCHGRHVIDPRYLPVQLVVSPNNGFICSTAEGGGNLFFISFLKMNMN